jgi:hypothetical protein
VGQLSVAAIHRDAERATGMPQLRKVKVMREVRGRIRYMMRM